MMYSVRIVLNKVAMFSNVSTCIMYILTDSLKSKRPTITRRDHIYIKCWCIFFYNSFFD